MTVKWRDTPACAVYAGFLEPAGQVGTRMVTSGVPLEGGQAHGDQERFPVQELRLEEKSGASNTAGVSIQS